MTATVSQFKTPMSNPEPEHANAALAATLRERARVLDNVGAAGEASALRTMDHPSWQDLQRQERSQADTIAEFAAMTLFGVNTRDRLTPKVAADLEQASTSLVRRIHPEWVQAAHELAVESLLLSDEFQALASGRQRNAGELRVLAHRLASTVRGAYLSTLEGTTPLKPAIYLRCSAAAVERGAR